MKKSIVVIALLVLLAGCKPPPEKYFWYPVELLNVSCSGETFAIYRMTNTVGWRSWPYLLEKSTRQEIQIGTSCIFRTVRRLPEHKGGDIRRKLTAEQRQYLVEGFNDDGFVIQGVGIE